MNFDVLTWRMARRAFDRAIKFYLFDPNVSLVDLGHRIHTSEGNRIEQNLTTRVHVKQKLYGEEFKKFSDYYPHRVINAQKIGFAVDVPCASYLLNQKNKLPDNPDERLGYYQELRGGICISNVFNQCGTLGGKVQDRISQEEMILGSWHILAGSCSAQQGNPIYQPAEENNGNRLEPIAEYSRGAMRYNLDVAVARLYKKRSLNNNQLGLGSVTGVTSPQLGMRVIKSGAGTGITSGIITGMIGYTVQHYEGVAYVIGPVFHILTEKPGHELCGIGDSGAWWLEPATMRAVGLHFASSEDSQFGLAFSMSDVLRVLNVEIVTEPTVNPPLSCFSTSPHEKKAEIIPNGLVDHYQMKAPIGEIEFLVKYKQLIEKIDSLLRSINIKKIFQAPQVNINYKRIMAIGKNLTSKFYYQILQISLILLFFVVIFSFKYYQPKRSNQNLLEKLNHYQNTLAHLQAMAQIDWERINDIKKITQIINQHNEAMDSVLKLTIASEIYQMSKRYSNLDIELICATITHETGLTWDPKIVSPANAIGLMQIMPATGMILAKEVGLSYRKKIEEILCDPIINIRLGCRYLSFLISMYDIDGGLAAYNGGTKRTETWLRNGRAKGILHEETDKYVPSILKIYREYQQM